MIQPAFNTQLPDLDGFIGEARARADGLVGNAWAQFSRAVPAPRPVPAQAGAGYADSFRGWTAPGQGQDQNSRQAPNGGPLNDDWARAGFADNVPRSLIGTESGGNWLAANNETGSSGRNGHFGILQFGHDRLDDAKRAGAIPAHMTPEQFMASKPAQVAAANWHFSDIDNRIRKAGYDRMIGMNVGGVPLSWDGMRAMAHLGGFGGLSKFISSGGRHNPSDSFATSLSAYGRRHAS